MKTFKQFLAESKEDMVSSIKTFEADILSEVSDDVLESVIEREGFDVYDGMICINVKGRPDINVDIPDDEQDRAETIIQQSIESLAKKLGQDDDFMILGRMGGYWGYKFGYRDFKINEKGISFLKDKVTELMENDGEDPDAYDAVSYYRSDLAYELYSKHISLSDEMIKKMKNLSAAIDKEEVNINNKIKNMLK